MRGLLVLALALVQSLAIPVAASATLPPLPVASKPEVRIFSFAAPPASVTCGAGSVRLVEGAAMPPTLQQVQILPVGSGGPNGWKPPPPPTSEVYTFSVSLDGRVIDLTYARATNVPWSIDQHTAIIAAWRFAPGAGAKDCRVDLTPTYAPLAQTSPARLFELLADDPRNANTYLRQALAAEGDCYRAPRRRPQTVTYPDLRPFDDKNVDPAWVGVRYDIDAGGVARNVRIAAQHGESAFADTAASAVAEARFFPGSPRKGCYAAYKATPKASETVAPPKAASFERPGDDCKITEAEMNLPELKYFPPAFAKRRVAGWAIMRFDVAPWGQIGSVEVVAAQPTTLLGEWARGLVMGARPAPPPTGYRGCLLPVIYAIPTIPEDEY